VLAVINEAHQLMLDPEYLELIALGALEDAEKRLKSFEKTRMDQLTEEQKTTVKRAKCFERYFTQPFVIAEGMPFPGKKGVSVKLKDTIDGAKRILAGEFDNTDLEKLTFMGSI